VTGQRISTATVAGPARPPADPELAIPPLPPVTLDDALARAGLRPVAADPITVSGIPVLAVGDTEAAGATIAASHPRSWRNKNPGNLRTIPGTQEWNGCIAEDTAKGGPFAIFGSRVMGWRALCVCLLTYRNKYGLRSVRAILTRYAPDMENDTASYVDHVAKRLGVSPLDPIDVTDPYVMRELLLAIAAHEGGQACPAWPDAELVEGMKLAGLRGPG